jgi:hypothetical protein
MPKPPTSEPCHHRRLPSAHCVTLPGNGTVAGQRLRVGRSYTRQTAAIAIENNVFRVLLDTVELCTHARRPGSEVT